MYIKIISLLSTLLLSSGLSFAEDEATSQQAVELVTPFDSIGNWGVALFVVLCLIFMCAWLVKKIGAFSPVNSKDKMKVVAGLSLGGREKILLVQVGEKQLVLGVSPGRIDNLLVLEDDDRIFQEKDNNINEAENDFSQKLQQIVNGSLKK